MPVSASPSRTRTRNKKLAIKNVSITSIQDSISAIFVHWDLIRSNSSVGVMTASEIFRRTSIRDDGWKRTSYQSIEGRQEGVLLSEPLDVCHPPGREKGLMLKF